MRQIIILLSALFTLNICLAEETIKNDKVRQGFMFGISAGAGPMILKEADNDSENYTRILFPNFQFGWMLSPRTALFLYIPTGLFERNDEQRAFEASMPALKYWVDEKFWVLGGIGVHMDFPLIGTDGEGFYTGPAFCAGAGYEIGRYKSCVIDLSTRYQYGRADIPDIGTRSMSGFDLLLGFSWY